MERTPKLTKEFLLTKFNMLNIKYIFESFGPINKYQESFNNELQLYKTILDTYSNISGSSISNNILYKYYLDVYNSIKNIKRVNISINREIIIKNITHISDEITELLQTKGIKSIKS